MIQKILAIIIAGIFLIGWFISVITGSPQSGSSFIMNSWSKVGDVFSWRVKRAEYGLKRLQENTSSITTKY